MGSIDYQCIVVALKETIRLMGEIDEVIEAHGGWPAVCSSPAVRDAHDLYPANAEELATIAQETVAEVLRGALRYPSESGGCQLGDVDRGAEECHLKPSQGLATESVPEPWSTGRLE